MSKEPLAGLPFLQLEGLHTRHPGLTEALAGALYESAAVCFARHHQPPIVMALSNETDAREYALEWTAPDLRTLRAWAETDETTEFGACCVTMAAVEVMLGLYVIERAERRIGADYYVSASRESLERARRLEVSGVDHGSEATVVGRLRAKVEQTKRGDSNLPALAAVVGFRVRRVMLQSVES